MREKKSISPVARSFVERKLEQFRKEAGRGSGLHYEVYAQNFTDSVHALAGKAKRADLREHLLSEAKKNACFVEGGRWAYDVENNETHWRPDTQSPARKYGAPAAREHEARERKRTR